MTVTEWTEDPTQEVIEERICDALTALVHDAPRERDDLIAELASQDLVPTDDEWELEDWLDEVLCHPQFLLDDELVGYAPTLLEGVVACHRLTASELERGAVSLDRSLGAIDWNLPPTELTVDGCPARREGAWLIGPPGWLDDVEPGQVVAFRRVGSDLVVDRAPLLGDGRHEADAIATAAGEMGVDLGLELAPMMAAAVVRDPSLFRSPVPPLPELLWEFGMERRRHAWGLRSWAWRPRFARGDDRAASLEVILAAFEDGVVDDLAGAGDMETIVARALDELLWVAEGHGANTIQALLSAEDVPDIARAILEASLAERAGDPASARTRLLGAWEAERLSSVGERLAEYAFWAGDLDEAGALADATGDAERVAAFERLSRTLRDAARRTPRNGACPCGSGRKFKHCCLRSGTAVGGQRTLAALVRSKLALTYPRFLPGLFGDDMVIAAAHRDELAVRRAPLLPPAERSIFDAALSEPARLWQIVETSGETAIMCSGEHEVDVHGVEGDPGDWALARVLPQHGIVFGPVEGVDARQAAKAVDHVGPDAPLGTLLAAIEAAGDD